MDMSLIFSEPWYVRSSRTCPLREYMFNDFEGDGASVSVQRLNILSTTTLGVV